MLLLSFLLLSFILQHLAFKGICSGIVVLLVGLLCCKESFWFPWFACHESFNSASQMVFLLQDLSNKSVQVTLLLYVVALCCRRFMLSTLSTSWVRTIACLFFWRPEAGVVNGCFLTNITSGGMGAGYSNWSCQNPYKPRQMERTRTFLQQEPLLSEYSFFSLEQHKGAATITSGGWFLWWHMVFRWGFGGNRRGRWQQGVGGMGRGGKKRLKRAGGCISFIGQAGGDDIIAVVVVQQKIKYGNERMVLLAAVIVFLAAKTILGGKNDSK